LNLIGRKGQLGSVVNKRKIFVESFSTFCSASYLFYGFLGKIQPNMYTAAKQKQSGTKKMVSYSSFCGAG
jgi:hypothetical protein